MRLDIYLTTNNLTRSRSQAQDLIKRNLVVVNDEVVNKSNHEISSNDNVEIIKKPEFVSRAGDKLNSIKHLLKFEFENKVVLDIGASTGGFSDFSLQNGASFVYCLDVGTEQLDKKIKEDKRTLDLSNTNLKTIPDIEFDKDINIVLCDVSFISLKHVFESIKKLIKEDVHFLFLIKPQFETDNIKVKNFKGKIKNEKDIEKIIKNIFNISKEYNLELIDTYKTEVLGKKKENQEYFGYFKKWK